MIIAGLKLMALGMGIVFIFLVLLYFAINLLGMIAGRFTGRMSPETGVVDRELPAEEGPPLAVIAAALEAYRRDRKRGRS